MIICLQVSKKQRTFDDGCLDKLIVMFIGV